MVSHPLPYLSRLDSSISAFGNISSRTSCTDFIVVSLSEDSASSQSEGSSNSLAKKTDKVKPHVLLVPNGVTQSHPHENANPLLLEPVLPSEE
jgi:hypothetical protein